jgi:AraC-like DNA-binding protein
MIGCAKKAVMHPNFFLPDQQDFELSPALPHNYKGIVLQGASILTAHHPVIGQIVLQELKGSHYTIRFNIFNFLKPFTLNATQQTSMLASFHALKNSIRVSLKGLGPSLLAQGQFLLLHSKEREGKLAFASAGAYHSFEVNWSEKMLEQYQHMFPVLTPLSTGRDSTRSFYVTPQGKTADFRCLGLAQSIIAFRHKDAASQVLFEHKIEEYYLSLLVISQRTASSKSTIRKEDYDNMQALAKRLRDQPERKFPITELSRELAMNEKKLEHLFSEIFGTTILQYHLENRLKEAHRLLEETDYSTKKIRAMVGYDLTTSFITQFRRYFGYPPSEVKRTL